MTKIGLIILMLLTVSLEAQDSTVFYSRWDGISQGRILDTDSLQGTSYTVVTFQAEKPVMIQRYAANGNLEEHFQNEYDSLGNNLVKLEYYPNGILKERWSFQNSLEEIHLFRRIYGDTFKPLNRNYVVNQIYNSEGRETGYFVTGVDGKSICHQETVYDDQGRKYREFLVDDLKKQTLIERRYTYKDEQGTVVLEEFDKRGKLVQRVVLFDDDIYPAE